MRGTIRKLHAGHGNTEDKACCSAFASLFSVACRLGRSQRQHICQTNDNEMEAWETLFKNSDKQEKTVVFNWPKVYPLFVLVLFAFTRPSASSGTARIIPASLSALWSVWESYKSAGCTLYICQPFCSVKGEKKICSTPALWFTRLLIPGKGYNSSLPPSFAHSYSLSCFISWPLFGFSLLLLWIWSAEAPVLECYTFYFFILFYFIFILFYLCFSSF